MKKIIIRSISGLVYVALIIGSLIAGAQWFTALAALFALLAVWELNTLFHHDDGHRSGIQTAILVIDILASTAIVAITAMGAPVGVAFALTLSGIYCVVRIVLSLYDTQERSLRSVCQSALSLIYIAIPLATLSTFNMFYYNTAKLFGLVMLMFVMIWLNDTGAYCVGCTLGKHRLCERLSPKKSWEGFWGGMVFAAAAGAVYGLTLGKSQGVIFYILMGVVVSIFATWGDLFESLIKRTLGVKDSGKIMPGHGGILDRIDSLLLVAPATQLYVTAYEMLSFAIAMP